MTFDTNMGILGGLTGGFLATRFLGMPDAVNGINLGSVIVSFTGAVILIAIIRMLPGRSAV